MKQILFSICLLLLSITVFTQTTPKKKVYCLPIVSGQPVSKFISLQYEYQSGFDLSSKRQQQPVNNNFRISNARGIRFNANKNLIMKPKGYLNMGITYWNTAFKVENPGAYGFLPVIDEGSFHSLAVNGNFFRPLNQKNFILANFNIELNGNSRSYSNLTGENIFAGGALFFGWKKGFSRMSAIGVLRAYRLGRVIHVPALLYNRSFNKKWGMDMLLPARLHMRYQPNPNNMFLAGYELEGGQFRINSLNNNLQNSFFQRGEVRPRISYERKLNKYCWLTASAGMRINARFDLASKYDGETYLYKNDLNPTPFFNVGFHVVKINKAKK